MTTDDDGGAPSEAAVRAAAERWARAAGVPVEVAHGSAPVASTGVRFMGGLMIGIVVGGLLLVAVSGNVLVAVPWVLLALGLGCLVAALPGRPRRVPARPVTSRS